MKDKDREPIKSKRLLLKFFLAACGILALVSFKNVAPIVEFINRVRNRFKVTPDIPEDNQRTEVTQLSEKGTMVSVEMALNSRCSSDYDDAPDLFHWGMFDKNKTLSNSQVTEVENYLHVPFFSKGQSGIRRSKNIFTFVVGNTPKGTGKDWAMVESGMQQQALCLVSSALAVGVRFKGMGENGKLLSDNTLGLVGIKLDAMKPSYNGSSWTESLPVGRRQWLPGNLPDPMRNGTSSLISELKKLQAENLGTNVADGKAISQILWAGRGRTPHRYKSKEWGLTIPTAHGYQDTTSVFYCSRGKVYKYVNWKKNRPTHHLEQMGMVDGALSAFFDNYSPAYNCFIILSRNQVYERALWEIGYELLNILLQSSAWGLGYKLVLLDDEQKRYFPQNNNINHPVAIIAYSCLQSELIV